MQRNNTEGEEMSKPKTDKEKITKLQDEISGWKLVHKQAEERASHYHSRSLRLEDLLMRMMQVHTDVVNELRGFNE